MVSWSADLPETMRKAPGAVVQDMDRASPDEAPEFAVAGTDGRRSYVAVDQFALAASTPFNRAAGARARSLPSVFAEMLLGSRRRTTPSMMRGRPPAPGRPKLLRKGSTRYACAALPKQREPGIQRSGHRAARLQGRGNRRPASRPADDQRGTMSILRSECRPEG